MKTISYNPKPLFIAALVFVLSRASTAFGNPTGLTISAGSASAQQIGSQLNVTVSPVAILNWQSFNIQHGETTTFLQPSSSSVVFNVIGGANPSQIFGNLNANGTVILANASGFYFGPDSMIRVGGSFIATTAPLPPDFGSGATWQFAGTPPLASIINYGQIEVGTGKSLYLIAENIENHGSLAAPQGDVELLAGDSVLVSERPDGRGLSASVQMPSGSVDNFGRITADAGTIALQAKVVNQDGLIQADSIAEKNGVIELVASDSLSLGANSQILARGENSANGSAGGSVTLKSANVFSDSDGSSIVTTGGANGGAGGNIEVSAPNILSLNSAMDARAQTGFTGGTFLLDPANIILGTSGSDVPDSSGSVAYNGGSGTLSLNVNTAFKNKNFSDIDLQASGDIYIGNGTVDSSGNFSFASSAGITWNLSASTGLSSGQLTLQAGNDIVFGDKSKILDANDWSVSLYAGYSFANSSIQPGIGNIYLNGGSGLTHNGTIQLFQGDVNLFAGQSILVAPINSQVVSGSIFTTGGGNIFAYAMAGDIIAGTSNGSANGTTQTSDYNFTDSGVSPNPFLGGISTAAGGNVTLIAGNNVDSTPKVPSRQAPGASGAYGSGDVTVIAGNQITGNYTLTDGIGTMLAGVQASSAQAMALQNPTTDPATYAATLGDLKQAVMQSQNTGGNIGLAPVNGAPSTAPITLSLTTGSWNVWAANDISLKEVNNPDGAFNFNASFPFDYAPDAAAHFWAGNAIELIGANLGRLTSENRTPIYAPVLSLNAGAGGIKIDKSIILAPSSEGSLSIITRNGGNLTGTVVSGSTVLNGITMSDSSSSDYTTFASEQDSIHLADPNIANNPNYKPVYLDISGSIGSFSLTVPIFADITVEGTAPYLTPDNNNVFGTYNFGFKGRNLTAAQTTSISVAGAITYRGDLTAIDLTTAQEADPLPSQLFTDSADTFVTSKLKFDPTTGELIYVGVMSSSDLAFLLSPSVLVLDKSGNPIIQFAVDGDGNPILDANGNPTTVALSKPLTLDDTQKALITQLYTASQSASLGDQGLALTGPGHFNVTANTIDLGVSGGIRVLEPDTIATSVPLTDPLPSALFDPTTSGNPDVAGKIQYDAATGRLIFNGEMSPAEFAFLLKPTEIVPDAQGNPTTKAITLDAAQLAAINQLYTENKNDTVGASLNVTTAGDLTMTSTKISNEAYLGSVSVNVSGTLDVGGQFTTLGDPGAPKGIFTTSGGDVSVIAHGDVNVNGSRIATYNGGDVTVISQTGNVNAGNGGAGYVSLSALELDPVTQLLTGIPATIPGSGILATTVFGSHGTLGDITINAPQGNVNASLGGVLQIAFNGTDTKNNFIHIDAEKDINASGSGIIGQNISLHADGDINGVVVGSQSVNIDSQHNVNVTAVSGGNVDINASGSVGGTIIGGGDVSVSGDSIDAAVRGGSVSTSGDTSSASLGVPQSNVAKDIAETADNANVATTKSDSGDDDDLKKKKPIALAQKVSRVTVILPGSK